MDKVFFNRVPKVGSEEMIGLIQILSKMNQYKHFNYDSPIFKTMHENVEVKHANRTVNYDEPSIVVQHVNYLNFKKYGLKQPIYINLFRNPVDRIISWFYYVRSPWIFLNQRKKKKLPLPDVDFVKRSFETCVLNGNSECQYISGDIKTRNNNQFRQTLFFCGMVAELCMPLNGLGPLQIAKRHVEEEYAVVGTWEDTNVTLTVLEHYIPKYFRGALQIYNSQLKGTNRNFNPYKPEVSKKVRDLVARNLTREIEFYEFLKQRLYKQYIAIKKDEIANIFNDNKLSL